MTIESDNFYGMRFNKTIAEFCESYNNNIENVYEQLGENKSVSTYEKIKPSDFSLYKQSPQNNFKQYMCYKLGYSISIFTELDSDYIVFACAGFCEKDVADTNLMFEFILKKVYSATIMSLTGQGLSSVLNLYKEYANEGEKGNIASAYFKNNVVYEVLKNNSSRIDYFYIYAMSEEKYKEFTEKIPNTQDTSSAANQSEAIEDIKQRISFFNSYYGYNFQPTDEQMEELVEFYNTFNETGDYGNDSLLSFLKQKGWIDTSSTNNNSNSVQQSNTTSSNKNNSSSQNTNDKTNKSEDIIATLNVNLKQLIANNTTAQEIKAESSRIDIHIYVEGCLVENGYFEYFDGGDSLPDTITDKATVLEYKKKPSEKRKVKITMDNTRTAIKETTLFEGEMVFDTTKTYEIK